MVEIRFSFPPNIDEIREHFPLSGAELFAYDNVIYNPSKMDIPPWLVDHEKVHFRQQGKDPVGWWRRYFDDEVFRYQQELEAHQIEYQSFCKYNPDRNIRSIYLQLISQRLASKMYGSLVTVAQARREIQ